MELAKEMIPVTVVSLSTEVPVVVVRLPIDVEVGGKDVVRRTELVDVDSVAENEADITSIEVLFPNAETP